jgi:hypothetical protein
MDDHRWRISRWLQTNIHMHTSLLNLLQYIVLRRSFIWYNYEGFVHVQKQEVQIYKWKWQISCIHGGDWKWLLQICFVLGYLYLLHYLRQHNKLNFCWSTLFIFTTSSRWQAGSRQSETCTAPALVGCPAWLDTGCRSGVYGGRTTCRCTLERGGARGESGSR